MGIELLLGVIGAIPREVWDRLRDWGPFENAVSKLEAKYPNPTKKELRPSLINWLKDDAARGLAKQVRNGEYSTESLGPFVSEFQRVATIPDLSAESAEDILSTFLELLDEEAFGGQAGQRQAALTRREHTETRRLFQEGLAGLASATPQRLVDSQRGEEDRETAGMEHAFTSRAERAFAQLKTSPVRAVELISDLVSEVRPGAVEPTLLARLHANLGTGLMVLGHHAEADQNFHTALDYDPTFSGALGQLAWLSFVRGDEQRAHEYAKRALEADAANVPAWLTQLHLGVVEFSDLPDTVSGDSTLLIEAAKQALQGGETDYAVQLAREALTKSSRQAVELVGVAEVLYLAGYLAGASGDATGPSEHEQARRLVDEVIQTVDERQWPGMVVTALLLRSQLSEDRETVGNDLRKARALEPEHVPTLIARAIYYLEGGELGTAASEAREASRLSPEDPRPHALLARVAASGPGDSENVEAHIRAALDRVEEGPSAEGLFQDLAGSASHVGLTDLAAELLEKIPGRGSYGRVVFEARVHRDRGSHAKADSLYRSAIAAAEAENDSRDVRIEYAGDLYRLGRATEAAEILKPLLATRPLSAGVASLASRIFISMQAWSRLSEVVEGFEPDGDRPPWLLEALTLIASVRNDLSEAISFLEEAVARGLGGSGAQIRLSHFLLLRGDDERAGDAAHEVARAAGDAQDVAAAAQILARLDQHEAAIEAAYRAFRLDPSNELISQQLASRVMMAPGPIDCLDPPQSVGPGTFVRLKDQEENELEFFVVDADEVIPGRPKEVLVSSPLGEQLLGKSIGDQIQVERGGPRPAQYTVAELESAILARARLASDPASLLTSGERPALQPIKLGSPDDVDYLAEVIETLHRGDRHRDECLATYAEQALPLAVTAQMAGERVSDLFRYLTHPSVGHRLLVESGLSNSVTGAVGAVLQGGVVVPDLTALWTLDREKLLGLLPLLFGDVRVPTSVGPYLRDRRHELAQEIARGGGKRIGSSAAGVALVEVPISETQAEIDGIDRLLEFIEASTTQCPRPLEEVEGGAKLKGALDEVTWDVLTLAGASSATLLADDLGLRNLCRELYPEARNASSYSIVAAGRERGFVEDDAAAGFVIELLRRGYHFTPVSAEILMAGFRRGAYSLGGDYRMVVEAIGPSHVPQEVGVRVGAEFLRKVCQHPLAGGAVGAAAWELISVFHSPHDGTALGLLDEAVGQALALFPIELAAYRNQRRLFARLVGAE